ncbi:MAG: MFS transporter [Legionellaceae bacterium]|nr:MFS transporter [Legionellaceae bacterium]|tara:strand:- start:214 stop:1518 length:1305 start_codon:yes stop_codon:yes gene_type:complete
MSDQSSKPVFSVLGFAIWGLGALFFLYEFFLRTFVGSVAHQVIPDLKLNAESFAIIGSAYYIAYAFMQIPVGILADKFGVKIIMIFATLVCAGATFLFAHSAGFVTALISRLLMGFGSSFAFVCLLVIAVTWFPRRLFGLFAGASQFIGTMGPLLAGGPLIAMMKHLHDTWRTALTDISFFGVILSVLILFIVKSKPRGGERELIFLKQEEPLKTRLLRLAGNNQAWFIAAYSACTYISVALLGAIWGTEYLQVRGLSQGLAATMVSLAWLGYAVGCPSLGAFSDFTKRRKPALVFCSLLGLVVTAAIVYLPLDHVHWFYGVLFFGLGIAGSGQNVGFAAIAEHVDLETRATALGLNNGAITLFGAIIPPVVSYFVYLSAGPGVKLTVLTPHNFTFGFTLMPIFCLISLFVVLFGIRETYCKPRKEMIKLRLKS